MHLERITSENHPMYKKAMELYHKSFPWHEQRENSSQDDILGNEAYHFDLVYDGVTFVGEVLYWEIADFLYIEHFCILPEMRSRGYGEKVLSILQEKPLILEIDPPQDEISIRRKGFYQRCGFTANTFSHVHPPYHKDTEGHALVVMSSPRLLTQDEYDTFRRSLETMVMKNVYNNIGKK